MGAESTGAAATDAGPLVCAFRRNTSAPPVRQAPTIHGVQLVSPSRRSGRLSAETAAASFGGILADVPSHAGGGGGGGGGERNDSSDARSCSRSHSSCFAFRAAAPAHPLPLFFFKSLTFSVKMEREKSRKCHNDKPQPFPDPKRKRKPTNLNKHKPNKRTKSTKVSSLLSKRGNRNTKRTEKHKNKMTHGKTYNKSPRRINHKATKSKTNTGTTALERSVEQTTGGGGVRFKALLQLANFTLGPDATLSIDIHKNSVRIKAPNSVNASKRNHKNQINHYNKQRRVLMANST